jgi:hypothetical protein
MIREDSLIRENQMIQGISSIRKHFKSILNSSRKQKIISGALRIISGAINSL